MNKAKKQAKKQAKKKIKKTHLFSLLVLLVIAGLVISFFLSLPNIDHLKTQNPKTTSLIEQRKKEAKIKGRKFYIQQKWLPFSKIPELLKNCARISEDGRFYQHNGIDYYELKEAIKKNFESGKKARGGSTITQQLAKNLFLSTRKSYIRKIRELFIAKRMEKHLSKQRIFSLYLNLIEFGHGIFGVRSAAEFFFKKPVSELNLTEIVRLVAVIPKPLRVTPNSNSGYMKWRAKLLLKKLHKLNYISDEEYFEAQAEFE